MSDCSIYKYTADFFYNILTCDANKDVQQNTSEKAELSEKRESKRVHKGLN